MASNSKVAQRRLIKKHNIHFDNPAESPFHCPAQWPVARGTLVKHVQTLGQAQYHRYQESISCDSLHRPWREQVRRRAQHIADLSQRCLTARKNEPGWRFSVEVEVMARMSIEVACRKCRGRLWRSEQEVEPSPVTEEAEVAARRLRQRQLDRAPCVCDPNEPQGDWYEPGINPLFDCHIEEAIIYPPELQSELPKREEKPDRVYGLRSTRRLERILCSSDKRLSTPGQCIGDSIKSHPFREDAEPVHFPFLILEAKSEKGSDSFSDAANQTAFSIRELLMIQEDLRVASGDGPDWDAGPLVWFLSYKGEEWKVCIAYIETENDCTHFRVVQIWRGAVNLKDNALRLLLIIDYIFDWARDIYREAIIRSLRKLTISDSRSLAYQDSDLFSTTNRVRIWIAANENGDELGGPEREGAVIRDALRSFDTRHGVIRDIRYIQSRFLGLYVTRENLEAFLHSASTEQESRALAFSLLGYLLEGWRVKGETLDALEFDWTGKDRGRDHAHQETTFLVVASVAAYLTPDWEQTRELSYLAVEEGAVSSLLKHAGRMLAEGHQLSDLPFVGKDAFSDSLLVLRRQSAGNNLLACISRVCLSTGILSTKESEYSDALCVISVEKSDQGVIFRADTVLKPDTAIKRDFVRTIYDQHKVGRNEPFCPFLRASSVLDELGLREMEVSRWFKRTPEIPGMPDHGVIIATSSNPIAGSTAPRLCLFVTDPAGVRMSGAQFQELLQSEPPWHFRVKRYDNRRGWSNGWNYELEHSVIRYEPILHRLTAFVEALKTPEVHSSQRQDDIGEKDEQAWAPKKPNSLWDFLVAPDLEFIRK
ncbi:Heterokaryon incompatibility domain-containing protein [Madurella fahalii]|uniref:Heterokaryon incompatibility domain-containing protein n=1 Tax=Madurella fahalii TaxID=1157608 RepID=A0ABQ0G0T4_9PEZI